MGSIIHGFAVALQPANLLFVLIGAVIGMIVGVLPGLGPAATIALLLPLSYSMNPTSAVIMLAGVYYGSMYGGTITSVLLRLPGEAASVVTAIDGHQMARQGRAGPALGISAIGSFIGGTVALIGLTFFAPPLADLALKAGPPEYAALAALGIVLVAYMGSGSLVKALIAAAAGLLLASVGQDPISGAARFTGGSSELLGGLEIVAIAMGLFGIGEILYNLETHHASEPLTTKIKNILPTRADLAQSRGAILRGSVLGFVIGALPGGGGTVSSLLSYAWEKRRAKQPERFGKGAIEGVAGPETANNASSSAAFIPLLTLGLPANAVLALLYGALLLQGITPGPRLVEEHPDIFWGVIASMYIGNVALLLLSLPLVGIFVRMVRIRLGILAPVAVLLSLVGAYTVNNSIFDVWVAIAFGVLGYVMRKTGFEPGPLILAFILGGIIEASFRQSMLVSNGSLRIFVTRPVAAAIVLAAVALLTWPMMKAVKGRRDRVSVGAN
jgi:putative tricarboxylic transport membrane protein